MGIFSKSAASLSVLALAVLLPTQFAAAPPVRPRTFLLDPARLGSTKDAIARHDPSIAAAWAALEADAAKALNVERFSVVDKGVTPPSGDKHDYMSQAPYFWADPTKPNGLPYIRRDGERNPELKKISEATGGKAFTAPDPTKIGDVFYGALSTMLCQPPLCKPTT